ncbi:MAG: AAA family ATPase [Deltaproteobacteria bacterium]|nr:AAA family ATPase [Deltaproteobacteria bacterium]
MNPEILRVSILYGAGEENPRFREVLQELPDVKFLKQAVDPETFLSLHGESLPPHLVLVDLNGLTQIPEWLGELINQMPRSEIAVCSQSRDPDFLIRIMKLRVGSFIPLPLQRQDLEEAVARVRTTLQERPYETSAGQVIVVTGAKGGVGTTSIAVNLALALNESAPGETLLVDLARPFAQVGQFLDIKTEYTIRELMQSADSLDSIFLRKVVQQHKSQLGIILSNLGLDTDYPQVIDTQALGKVFTAFRNTYNWIVVDAGFWLDYLYVKLIQEADYILMLTELSVPDLQNLKKIKAMFWRWELDDQKLKVVVNRYEKDYTLGLGDLETILLKPAFYTLPSDYHSMIEAINQGLPLAEVAPRSKLWRKIKGLAHKR